MAGFTSRAAKTPSLGCTGCCRQLGGGCFFQNLKIQRSVGRAKDGTTFPLSLKLKSEPSSETVEVGRDVPKPGYSASVWVFSTLSGLLTLLPDGTIYGINHNFALMLFGYGKTELLGKVGGRPVCPCGAPVCSVHCHSEDMCLSQALCPPGCRAGPLVAAGVFRAPCARSQARWGCLCLSRTAKRLCPLL